VKEYWGDDYFWATPKDLSDLNDSEIKTTIRKISALGLKSCAATLLPINSVLFSSRAPIGLVAINAVPIATNQGFKNLVPNRNLVDTRINSTFEFLQGEYLTKLLKIDIANSNSAYQSIHILIDEIYEREYRLEEIGTEEVEYFVEANTEYSNSLEDLELSFDSIRNIAVRKCRGIDTHLVGRGVTPLREENELYVYLLRYGNMHKAKLESCFHEFPFAEINQPIEVIDWGCGQGLASLVLFDFLKSNEIEIPVSKISLIEPSPLSIKRAALHLKTYPSLQTAKTICKYY
jgi:hypothetical protein